MLPLPDTMNAMLLRKAKQELQYSSVALPVPQPHQVLIKIKACGVCRTDLHIIDGELDRPKLPLIPGHEILGTVAATGSNAHRFKETQLVGVPWLGYTCAQCKYCLNQQENLCSHAGFTGYTIDGGYAEYTVADERFCFPLSASYGNATGAPLLCAGLIGYRAYRMIAGTATNIGFYGFGAAAHILVQLAHWQGKKIFAFTRTGDVATQQFARNLGAAWAGNATASAPEKLDAAIIFAPAGNLVPAALKAVDKAGTVLCAGIHMTDIPAFAYRLLWEERILRSVANLTRKDADEFLELAPRVPIHTEIQTYPLKQANEAVEDLRMGRVQGAAVLVMD